MLENIQVYTHASVWTSVFVFNRFRGGYTHYQLTPIAVGADHWNTHGSGLPVLTICSLGNTGVVWRLDLLHDSHSWAWNTNKKVFSEKTISLSCLLIPSAVSTVEMSLASQYEDKVCLGVLLGNTFLRLESQWIVPGLTAQNSCTFYIYRAPNIPYHKCPT